MFFIIEDAEKKQQQQQKKVLGFSKGTVKVLRFCLILI